MKKISLLFILLIMLCGCSNQSIDEYKKNNIDVSMIMKDDHDLYEDIETEQVLYLTIGRGDEDSKAVTWKELNKHDITTQREDNGKLLECDALVQFGNEDGPTSDKFGYGNISANAKIKLSGEKASTRQQKNYKIKLNANSGSINGIKTFILDKNFSDPFRFTNKLCFDILSEIDTAISVRTCFVHLYVRDETDPESNGGFDDYGLYTMLETVNKNYLLNRDLDASGELYKINDFDFERYTGIIMQPTDAGFNKAKFEEKLEAKGSDDYSKLINLLDAINDESIQTRDLIDTYFDDDNLYTWLAFNILVDNKSTDTTNFYIYSPTGTDKFYIIPWDFSSAFRDDYKHMKDPSFDSGWERGIYLYTESQLFSRIMQDEHCINELSERISELHDGALSKENILNKANELKKYIKPHLYVLPDITFARVTESNYEELIRLLSTQIDNNYYAYYDSLETPWPFHILEPTKQNDGIVINWEASHILKGDITYSVAISEDWDFKEKIKESHGIKETSFNAGTLPKGQYFVKVTADTANGMSQVAYESFSTEKKTVVNGILCFYVLEDGSVKESVFETTE